MNKEELKRTILAEYEKGNVVVATEEGLAVSKLDEFIEQPTTSLLYDLNRLPEVVFAFLDDPKWVNDYAVAMVISKLKAKIAALESKEITAHLTTTQGRETVRDCHSCLYYRMIPDCGDCHEYAFYKPRTASPVA
jgi:hypothetical protein